MDAMERKLINLAIQHLMADDEDPLYSWEQGMNILDALRTPPRLGLRLRLRLLLAHRPKEPPIHLKSL